MTGPRSGREPRPRSRARSLALCGLLAAAWIVLRLAIFDEDAFPVTYLLPLIVCGWTCDLLALWGMTAVFATAHTLHFWLHRPGAPLLSYEATLINLAAGSVAVHLLIRQRLAREAALQERERAAEEVRAQAEELAQQGEELHQQHEELTRRHEELQAQAEEIHGLNAELTGRERLLQQLLEAARPSGTESAALQQVADAARDLLGEAAAVVFERDGGLLVVRACAGLEQPAHGTQLPAQSHFAEIVMSQGRTASLSDSSLRPDLVLLGIPGEPAIGSVLAAPLLMEGAAVGVLAAYARRPCEWSQEQYRLAEWLAASASHALETVRNRERLQRQAALLDLSQDAIFVRALGGRIEQWTRGAEALYGWSAAEAQGRSSHELLRTRFPRPWPEIEAEIAAAGRWSGQLVHRTKDGRELVIESRWLVERWPDGAVRSILESNIDVSVRERTEQELRQMDRRKSEFLAVLSHELRNPLAPMRYAIDLLRHGRAGGAVEPLSVIERQLAHLVHLVDDLLDLSRIEADKVRLQRRLVSLADVVHEAVEAARPEIEGVGHELAVSLPAEPLVFDADLDRLVQALTNLLNNAARYTPRGGRIRLDAERDGARLRLAVSDTGIGLAPQDLDRVFDMFTQIGEPGRGGLGIGLALVRRVAELHGGSVSARSDGLGCGARFEIVLPLAATESDAPPAPSAPQAAAAVSEPAVSEPAATAAGRRRVLVVDDNRDAADMMRAILELHGHEVRVAYDGATALDRLDGFRPNVALLDIGLPGMDGYELARRLREHPGCRAAYLVAVTGWGQSEDRARALAAGFDAHLTKPAEPEVVHRLVTEAPDRD